MLGVSVMAINVPKEYEVPLYLFHQGKNAEAYKLFGSHFAEKDGVRGVVFRVWAPKAADVSVVGDFNHWNREESYMKKSATAVSGSFLSPDSRSLIITNTA